MQNKLFFLFIPNYFSFSHSLIFVKSMLHPFCRAKHFCAFCVFCVIIKQNVKQFHNPYYHPEILVFQPISAFWTFPRGNLDFPLTKLPLSPNETSRFPRALSVSYFLLLYSVKTFFCVVIKGLKNVNAIFTLF